MLPIAFLGSGPIPDDVGCAHVGKLAAVGRLVSRQIHGSIPVVFPAAPRTRSFQVHLQRDAEPGGLEEFRAALDASALRQIFVCTRRQL